MPSQQNRFEDPDATEIFSAAVDDHTRPMSTTEQSLPKVTPLNDDYGDGNWENPEVPAYTQDSDYAQHHQSVAAYSAPVAQPVKPSPQAFYPAHPQVSHNYAEQLHSYVRNEEVQEVAAYPPERTTRRAPILAKTRRALCIILAPFFLLSGVASALAYWTQQTIIDPQGFSQISSSMAHNADFQSSLANSVADDVMNSSSVQSVLGDGNSTAWYGSAQNWLHDQVNTTVHDSAQAVVTNDNYPQTWETVMNDTHNYLFNGEVKPAALDLNYLYDQVDQTIGQSLGIDINADADQKLVLLDGSDGGYPINSFAQRLTNFAASWKILTGITAALGLAMFALWPKNRFLFTAIVGFIGAAILWIFSMLASGATWGLGSLNIPTDTGKTFMNQLVQTLSGSVAEFAKMLATNVALVSAVCLLLAIAISVVSYGVRATTSARTR